MHLTGEGAFAVVSARPSRAKLEGVRAMATTEYIQSGSSVQASRDHDGWVRAGCGILGLIALAALYFASGGPGKGETALAVMLAMP